MCRFWLILVLCLVFVINLESREVAKSRNRVRKWHKTWDNRFGNSLKNNWKTAFHGGKTRYHRPVYHKPHYQSVKFGNEENNGHYDVASALNALRSKRRVKKYIEDYFQSGLDDENVGYENDIANLYRVRTKDNDYVKYNHNTHNILTHDLEENDHESHIATKENGTIAFKIRVNVSSLSFQSTIPVRIMIFMFSYVVLC